MRLTIVAKIEYHKLLTRFNIIFLSAFMVIVAFQVLINVRLDTGLERNPDVPFMNIYSSADRYIYNLIFTVIPLMFLINLSREFENYIVHRFLVSGLSRKDYFMGKIMQAIYFSVIGAMMVGAFRLLVSGVYNIPLHIDLTQLLLAAAIAFYLCNLFGVIVFFVQKTTYSILFFVAYIIIEGILLAYLRNKGFNVYLPFNTAVEFLRKDGYEAIQLIALFLFFSGTLSISWWRFRKCDLY